MRWLFSIDKREILWYNNGAKQTKYMQNYGCVFFF